MEKPLNEVYLKLQKLIGLHRQLMETVRMERDSLVQADVSGIHEATSTKQAIIHLIEQCEKDRINAVGELALIWKKNPRELTLSQIIIQVQGFDIKRAEVFRSAQNALSLLVQRIREQNEDNRQFVDRSLEHVNEMKKNVLGESVPHSNTYTPQGQRAAGSSGSRLVNKEV